MACQGDDRDGCCPTCNGKSGTGSQASQSLGWALATASTRGGSRFWRALLAAEVYQRSRRLGEHDPIDSYVADLSEFASVLGPTLDAGDLRWAPVPGEDEADGDGSKEDLSPWDLDRSAPPGSVDYSPWIGDLEDAIPPFDVPEIPGDPPPIRGPGLRCCVLEFDYPLGEVRRRPPSQDQGPAEAEAGGMGKDGKKIPMVRSTSIGIAFDVHTKYDKLTPCLCECCEFRQLVLKDEMRMEPALMATGWPPGANENGVSTETGHDGYDCLHVYYLQNADGSKTVLGKFADPNEASKVDWPPATQVEVICVGERRDFETGARGAPQRILDPVWRPNYSPDGCIMDWTDEPSRPAYWGTRFTYTFSSAGLIFDRCRNWALVAWKKLEHVERGVVKVNGEVEFADGEIYRGLDGGPMTLVKRPSR